jgi:hypothetical protein
MTDRQYLYELIMETGKDVPQATNHIHRKVESIIKHSDKYELPRRRVGRIQNRESDHKRTAYNKNSGARGLMQVTSVWDPAAWRLDNGKLGKYLNEKGIVNVDRFKHRIGYGTEWGCYALRQCLRHKKQNWTNAILMYAGFFTKGADMKKGTNYLNYILDIE